MAEGFINWPFFIEYGRDLCVVIVLALILYLALKGHKK